MNQQSFETKISYYLAACYSLLAVESHEEGRCLGEIRRAVSSRNAAAKANETRYYEWDVAAGLVEVNPEDGKSIAGTQDTKDPIKLMAAIGGLAHRAVVVLRDLHPFLANASVSVAAGTVCRQLRNLAVTMRNKRQTILLLSPRLALPVELQKEVQLVEYSLPDAAELNRLLDLTLNNIQKKQPEAKVVVSNSQREAIIEAARGMTSLEADNALSLVTIITHRETGKLSLNGEFSRLVFEEKIVNLKNGFLDYMPTKAGFDSIGGMEELKKWALQRRIGFEEAARAANLPYPRGCLLTGFAGCGKTAAAQAMASAFEFPLFSLNPGKLFGSKVGESEANVRELIRLMEGLGRVVILIDEMEKSFNESAVSGAGDSGTSSRVFGNLLTWLSLKTTPTFLIGTVNDIDKLPAALKRKGRFDEIWFVDLPTPAERLQIFNVLLKYKFKRKLQLASVNAELVEKTRDFTGAEIESAIEDSIYALIGDPKNLDKKLESKLVEVVSGINPQAQLDPAQVATMRKLAERGFRPTGLTPTKPVALAQGRDLAINN